MNHLYTLRTGLAGISLLALAACGGSSDEPPMSADLSAVSDQISLQIGATGTVSVSENDSANGQSVSLGFDGNATVVAYGDWPAGISLNSDGTILVDDSQDEQLSTDAPYELNYLLCDSKNGTLCAQGALTLTLTPPPDLIPSNDVVKVAPGDSANLFDNDDLSGAETTSSGVVEAYDEGDLPDGVTLDTDGTLSIGSETAPGNYSFVYWSCYYDAPYYCYPASVKLKVIAP